MQFYCIGGGGGGQKINPYLEWPPFASRSATHLLRIELIRLLIVACAMLVHSSSMAVRSSWILEGTGTHKSQITNHKSLLLSHHHSTSALVSEILMSVLQTVQKNNRQFTYGQTVQKKQQTIYIWTDSAKNCTGAFTVLQTVQKKQQQQFTYGQTVQKKTTAIYIWTDSAKKTTAIYIWTDSAKKTTAIYIWTVHIYRLYRRQCAKYTYMHSVRLVYYRDILNYQRHFIHRMGTSTLCTVSIHNVVYT